jgi:hypothetical protein
LAMPTFRCLIWYSFSSVQIATELLENQLLNIVSLYAYMLTGFVIIHHIIFQFLDDYYFAYIPCRIVPMVGCMVTGILGFHSLNENCRCDPFLSDYAMKRNNIFILISSRSLPNFSN